MQPKYLYSLQYGTGLLLNRNINFDCCFLLDLTCRILVFVRFTSSLQRLHQLSTIIRKFCRSSSLLCNGAMREGSVAMNSPTCLGNPSPMGRNRVLKTSDATSEELGLLDEAQTLLRLQDGALPLDAVVQEVGREQGQPHVRQHAVKLGLSRLARPEV